MREFETRTNIIRIRLNAIELEYIRDKAATAKTNVGDYLRRAGLRRRESKTSVIRDELLTLSARLLLNARTHEQQLDFAVVAQKIQGLIDLVEAGKLR